MELNVCVLGLGKMGLVLAKRIQAAGLSLTVYNRTASKMQPLIAAGAKGAKTPSEAVKEADIVLTSLFDDTSLLEVVLGEQGLLKAMKPGAIHLSTTTILPATSKQLTQRHQEAGSVYVAGNVLGVPMLAEKGGLTSLVAGDAHAVAACSPVLKTYSAKIIEVSQEPYQANVMKICCNYLLVTIMQTMGELYTFADKHQLDKDMLSAFFDSVLAHPSYKLYIDKIKHRQFDEVNFELSGGFKDITLFQKAFSDECVIPGMGNVIKDKFLIAMAQGMAHLDWSAMTEVTRREAGLDDER